MPKLQKSNNWHFLTIPQRLVQAKNWEKGQELHFNINENGDLVIKEVEET